MAELRFQDSHTTIYLGNSLHMAEIPDNSVHCVVSSPPYWGQRVYKGAQELVWGGDERCVHKWGDELVRRDRGTLHGANAQAGNTKKGVSGTKTFQGQFCQLCGAWRGAYGLEPTPEMWICHTLMFLREIRRVLRKDGVVWFNVDDKRWGSGSPGGDFRDGKGGDEYLRRYATASKHSIIKPLDLCLIPQRLAIACQEDGWYVRSVVMWEKPNPMPESVAGQRWERCRVKVGNRGRGKETFRAVIGGQDHDAEGNFLSDAQWQDCPGCKKCLPNDGLILRKGSWRPTESYETILMLTKTASYFADQEAVREPVKQATIDRENHGYNHAFASQFRGSPTDKRYPNGKELESVSNPAGRNLRDVWRFPTQPYKGAHFATFPEKLVEITVKASTSERGVCPKCGSQWARVIEKKPSEFNIRVRDAKAGRATAEEGYRATEDEIARYPGNHPDPGEPAQTLGWRPTCKCNAGDPISALVLDPFCGSGTTLWVAKKLGRQGIGYEISEDYCQMAIERTKQGVLL